MRERETERGRQTQNGRLTVVSNGRELVVLEWRGEEWRGVVGDFLAGFCGREGMSIIGSVMRRGTERHQISDPDFWE